ncbi:MAG: IS66 family transposase, partial [Saprospiraceae bacterium]
VEEIILEPTREEGERIEDLVKIGEEVTDELEFVPGRLFIRRYIRPKYARPAAEEVEEATGEAEQAAVLIAELPERPIPKGIPGVGLLAYLIVSKYIDHLPFYRQIERFKRTDGLVIHKSTVNDWFIASCKLLEPLYEALWRNVLETDYLQGDESKIKVLDRVKKKNTHLGWMWVFRNPATKNVLFVYRKGRGANVLHETLRDFTGLLQSDGYGCYKSHAEKHDVELISCLAHIRRKFFEAQDNHRRFAQMALSAIAYLYRVEAHLRRRDRNAEQRAALRQRLSRPAHEALLDWVNYEQANNLTKGAIGKALLYAKNHLPRLRVYLTDGQVEIDNNLIENTIRPLALGRKNYLFAGSHPAARRAAMMYAFFGSCKANDVNPWEWLRDVLGRIGSHSVNRLDELLPAQWKEKQDL